MRTILLGLLIFVSSSIFSQKNNFQLLSNKKTLGRNLINDSEIIGIQYIFPERIYKTFLDKKSGFLTVQLRGIKKEKWLNNKGYFLQYDLKNEKLLWGKKIYYQKSNIQQFSNTIIFLVANKSYCLDINTGKKLWKVKNNIYYVDPNYNIGIGYRFKNSTRYSNELEGINLKNGKKIWRRELNREYGWNDIFYTNDSTLIVVAAGLHSININNGKGWDYNTITGKKDYSTTVASNVAGVALGILTGTFVTATGHNVVRDVASNAIVDSLDIYFSSKKQLARINKKTGETLWSYPFSKDLPSKSTIFMNDSLIYMINKGYAFMGSRKLNFGKSFIAAFEKETGKQRYLSFIKGKDQILSFTVRNNDIYLVFKNRIAKYSQATGNLLKEKTFPREKFGELEYFVGNHVFITNENKEFISLSQADSTKIFVFTSKGKILSIDNQLNIAETIDYEDWSIYYLKTNEYKFIAKDKLTWIIDNKGQKVAELNMTSNAFLVGKTLYEKQNDSFIAIDLSDIIKDE